MTGPGTAVLLAVDGFSEPGRECLPGELLRPDAWCGSATCLCGDTFRGVRSHGTAALGRLHLAVGAPRAVFHAAIAAAMALAEDFEDPDRAAAAFLDELASIAEGRLVRREEDVLLPFPAAARITGPHSIEYGLGDEP